MDQETANTKWRDLEEPSGSPIQWEELAPGTVIEGEVIGMRAVPSKKEGQKPFDVLIIKTPAGEYKSLKEIFKLSTLFQLAREKKVHEVRIEYSGTIETGANPMFDMKVQYN